MEIYTAEAWGKDGGFRAAPGQEITEEIYNQMLNCLPPKTLPKSKADQALQEYKIPIYAGFLMGEPYRTGSDGRELYLAFGSNDHGSGKQFYFLGLAPELRRN